MVDVYRKAKCNSLDFPLVYRHAVERESRPITLVDVLKRGIPMTEAYEIFIATLGQGSGAK